MTKEEIIENLWGAVIRKNLDIGKSDIIAIVDFVMENQEQPSLPEGLDEIARDAFKAGAEWMAGQGETLESLIWRDEDDKLFIEAFVDEDKFKMADNVTIQIRKK